MNGQNERYASVNGYRVLLPPTKRVGLADRVLESLRRAGAATTWALVVRLGMNGEQRAKQAVATALSSLQRRGAVYRIHDPKNKRSDGLWVAA